MIFKLYFFVFSIILIIEGKLKIVNVGGKLRSKRLKVVLGLDIQNQHFSKPMNIRNPIFVRLGHHL